MKFLILSQATNQAHVVGMVFRCAPNQPQMRALSTDDAYDFNSDCNYFKYYLANIDYHHDKTKKIMDRYCNCSDSN